MPSMMVNPERMEFIEKHAKAREINKEEMLDVVIRAGIHRMNASINYAKKGNKKAAKPRKPRAAKPKAEKKAKAPKAKKAAGKKAEASLLD